METPNSLHNMLYGPSRLQSTAKSQDNFEDKATQSKMKADALIEWLRHYADERLNSRLIDKRRMIPPYVVLDFGNRGLLGLQAPESYGGLELSHIDGLRVIEQLAAIDLTLASFVGVHHALGMRPIMNYAQPTVRDELLPLIAQGRELAAFAITEPSAGSNPRAITATAIPSGKGGWHLNGQKSWIGTGAWASVINVFVQLKNTNGKFLGMTGFAVRQGTPGLKQGPEALTMGMRGMVQNTVYLNDVHVEPRNVLGNIGQGFIVAQDAMMFGRLGLASMSLGGMKRCAQLMLRYATRRKVSSGRLLDNPITQANLSNLTNSIATLESLVTHTATCLDNKQAVPEEIHVACKIAGPEFLWTAADQLVQLLGGRGYIETNIAPQLLRDARLLRIFEGPTETLNMFLGYLVLNSQTSLYRFLNDRFGAQEVSERLNEVAEAIKTNLKGIKGSLTNRISATAWRQSILGEATTFAILLAATQHQHRLTSEPHLQRAIDWAAAQFEDRLEKTLSAKRHVDLFHSSSQLSELIIGYEQEIGNVEQTLAGEDFSLDAMLQRHYSE